MSDPKEPQATPAQLAARKTKAIQDAAASLKEIADTLEAVGVDHVINVLIADPANPSIDGVTSHLYIGGTDIYRISGMAAQGDVTIQNHIQGTIANHHRARMEAIMKQKEAEAAKLAAEPPVPVEADTDVSESKSTPKKPHGLKKA